MYTDCNLYNENCMYEKNVLIYKWLTLGKGVWADVFPTLGSLKERSEASLCGNDGVRVGSQSLRGGGDRELGTTRSRGSATAATSKRHNNYNNYNTQCMARHWKCPPGVPH